MTTYWLTWDCEIGSIERLRESLVFVGQVGAADENWPITAHAHAATGDRVFLFNGSREPRGLFGIGTIAGGPAPTPAEGKAQTIVTIRLTKLVDPTIAPLLSLAELEDIVPARLINAPASGYPLPPAVAQAIAERLGLELPDADPSAVLKVVAFHVELSRTLAREGRVEEAVEEAAIATQIAPDSGEAHGNLGNLMARAERLGEADAELQRAIEIAPEEAAYHANISHVLRHLGRPEEAIAAARRAIELNPDDAFTRAHLGNLLEHEGRLDEAEAELQRAIQIAPENAGYHATLGHVLRRLNRPEEAIAAALRAIDLSPGDAFTRAHLGNWLADAGRLDEAEAELQRAVQIAPESAGYHANLSHVLRRLDRTDEAIAAARRATELNPQDAFTLAHLGNLLAGVGDLEPAAEALRQAVVLAPEQADLRSALTAVLVRQQESPNKTDIVAEAEPADALSASAADGRSQGVVSATPRAANPSAGSLLRRMFGRISRV